MHIFVISYSAYGAFMHFNCFGDVAEEHGAELSDTIFEKVTLVFYDFFAYF